ncbi:hypothetical protein QTN25_002619 [Entamoeba marina]
MDTLHMVVEINDFLKKHPDSSSNVLYIRWFLDGLIIHHTCNEEDIKKFFINETKLIDKAQNNIYNISQGDAKNKILYVKDDKKYLYPTYEKPSFNEPIEISEKLINDVYEHYQKYSEYLQNNKVNEYCGICLQPIEPPKIFCDNCNESIGSVFDEITNVAPHDEVYAHFLRYFKYLELKL